MNGGDRLQRFTTSALSGHDRHHSQPELTTRVPFGQQRQHQLLNHSLTRSHSTLGNIRRSHASYNTQSSSDSAFPHQHPSMSLRFTLPPPSGESLVELLREQRSPEIEPGKELVTERLQRLLGERGVHPNDDDNKEVSGLQRLRSDNTGSASLMQQSNHNYMMEDAASLRTSSPPRPSVKTRQQLTRAAKNAAKSAKRTTASAAAAASTAGARVADSGGSAVSGEKRSRYLREVDRRSIIHRIDRGEKQSELAKEFGVTRAAICHINKNRVEILTRSTRVDVHSNARHPKRGLYTTLKLSAFEHEPAPPSANQTPVFEVCSQAMALLLTRLRGRETDSREFQICTDRAFGLLLEEALVRVPTQPLDIATPNDFVCEGLSKIKPSCGVSISEEGFALLQIFRSIQPTSPSGFITLNATAIHEGISTEPTLQKVCIPPDLRAYDVFLLEATCATGAGACVVIQALLDFGAQEAAIHLVCLLASAVAVSEICSRFPAVRIVTGAVDPEVSDGGGNAVICPGLGNFTERYFNATVVHHTSLGANVDL